MNPVLPGRHIDQLKMCHYLITGDIFNQDQPEAIGKVGPFSQDDFGGQGGALYVYVCLVESSLVNK